MATSPLVSTVWLRQHISNGLKNIRLIDASWHMKSSGRNALEDYKTKRIDGAVFIDIDQLSDQESDLPHMLPSEEQFGSHVGELGMFNDDHVIVYDNNEEVGMFSAARLWWMFKVFGHQDISILDGGLPKWILDGGDIVGGDSTVDPVPVQYIAKTKQSIVRYMSDMEEALRKGDIQIVDARSNARFDGSAPEPRPGLPSGHMIGALNLPYTNLFNKETKTLASKSAIQEEFNKAGVDINKPIVATCGSGVTACWIAFAASLLGKEIPVYDGSWTEYAQFGPKDTVKLGISSNNGN